MQTWDHVSPLGLGETGPHNPMIMLNYYMFLGSPFTGKGECKPVILQVQLQRLIVRLVESGFPSKTQIEFLKIGFITLNACMLLLQHH